MLNVGTLNFVEKRRSSKRIRWQGNEALREVRHKKKSNRGERFYTFPPRKDCGSTISPQNHVSRFLVALRSLYVPLGMKIRNANPEILELLAGMPNVRLRL